VRKTNKMQPHVNKNPTRCNSMQIFIYCKVTLRVSSDTAPIIMSNKNCNRSLRYRSYWKKYKEFLWRCGPTRAMASSFLRFLDHTQRRITVGRTLLDEWSARRRDLYLTAHITHNGQISMPLVGIRTHDLNRRAAAGLRLRQRGHWDRKKYKD